MMLRIIFPLFTAGLAAWALGCSAPTPPPEPRTDAKAGSTKDDDHEHAPGQHGGIIVSIGRDSYHAEAVFERGGTLRLYMLGQDETTIQEVEARPLDAYARAAGAAEAEKFILNPEPQPGDRPGMTSLFVGRLPEGLAGKDVEVTIPNVAIGEGRFRIGFRSVQAHDAHAGPAMPTPRGSEEEEKLFLTPGGKYTEADIEANGRTVPSVKFRGIRATHDTDPKPGEPICPITDTKANQKFAWVVGGKTYEFCCPPCIEEFVATAKENPDEVKDPEFYRQK
jgi:YHS domain-containing protein